MKLTIELIPKTAWFKNLRSYLPKDLWDVVRKKCYKDAGYKCEICGGVGDKWPVECHEVWNFVEGKIILQRLIALCPSCHEVKHIGLAQVKGNLPRAMKHFQKVNNCDKETAKRVIAAAFMKYEERSKEDWSIDEEAVERVLKEDYLLNII